MDGPCGGDRCFNLLTGHRLHLLFLALMLGQAVFAQSNVTVLTREHTDFRILYTPASTNLLTLVARDEDHALNLASNDVFLSARSNSALTLPAGTPFGDAGQPLWILPQSQNVSLLYLGVSAEGVPAGVFNGPLSIQLRTVEGPGYFMAWQATGPGQFNIRMNTRDGISTNDAFTPLIGSHEHFNWGFSSTGIFCLTFQVIGRRMGETTNISSPWTTFVFHVQPLPLATNFPTWQKQFWPPGFNPAISGSNASPDGDVFNNFQEYAFGLSPTNANATTNAPAFGFVNTNGTNIGALTYSRYLPARDLEYLVEASSALPGHWMPLSQVVSSNAATDGRTARITVRDSQSISNSPRFFRLRPQLIPP